MNHTTNSALHVITPLTFMVCLVLKWKKMVFCNYTTALDTVKTGEDPISDTEEDISGHLWKKKSALKVNAQVWMPFGE